LVLCLPAQRVNSSAGFLGCISSACLPAIPYLFQAPADADYACLGASGAILAVLFASIVYFPRQSIMIMPIRCRFRHRVRDATSL